MRKSRQDVLPLMDPDAEERKNAPEKGEGGAGRYGGAEG